MRAATIRRFAQPLERSSDPLRQAQRALLPPIPLYRRLLRAHRRKLEPELRILGDQYVKSEFRAHRDIDNPIHIIGFLTEWQRYAQSLEGDDWRGEKMEPGKVEKMSDEQINQLYELMTEIRKHGQDSADEEIMGIKPDEGSGGKDR